MAYVKIANVFNQGTVLITKHEVDVKRGQSDGTYKGSTIMYEDKATGEAKNANIASFWLDKEQQAGLKAAFLELKPGDDFTVYKTKEVPEEDVEGKTSSQIRDAKIGYFGIKSIYPGHIRPPGMDEPCYGAPAPAAKVSSDKDKKGYAEGNVLNAVSLLLTPAKFLDDSVLTKAITAVAELKFRKEAEYKEKTKSNDYITSVKVSDALKYGATAAKKLSDMEQYVDQFLYKGYELAEELVQLPKVEKKTTPKPEPEKVDEPAVEEEPIIDEEEVPF